MPQKLFIDKWNQLELVSNELKEILHKRLEKQHLKKGEILYHQDERIHKVYFIVTGFLVGYRVEEKSDSVCWFLKEGGFVEDYESLLNQKLAKHTVIATEESTLLYLSYQDLQMMSYNFPVVNMISKRLLLNYLAFEQQRTLLLSINNCTKRYHRFIKEFPGVATRLKRGDIASFLNMSAETLSRIR